MAKSSRQTFKKRQREIDKKQKKQDKAKRLSARRGDEAPETDEPEAPVAEEVSIDGRPTLKVFVVGGASPKSGRS